MNRTRTPASHRWTARILAVSVAAATLAGVVRLPGRAAVAPVTRSASAATPAATPDGPPWGPPLG